MDIHALHVVYSLPRAQGRRFLIRNTSLAVRDIGRPSLQIIVFNPTPVPAAREQAPSIVGELAAAFHGSAHPEHFPHRPHTALGGDLDSAQFRGGHRGPSARDQNPHQQAVNGRPGPGEPQFAPAALAQALEAQHTITSPGGLQNQGEASHLVDYSAMGRSEDPAASHEDNVRPDWNNGGEGRAAVEPMELGGPAPATSNQPLELEPPLRDAEQQWQAPPSVDAWASQHHLAPPPAGSGEAGSHSAGLSGQQNLHLERPAGDVLTETQEELSKQEPAVSTGILNHSGLLVLHGNVYFWLYMPQPYWLL